MLVVEALEGLDGGRRAAEGYGRALTDRVGAAGQGTMNNVLIGGAGWVYYETVGGGEGGHPTRPGMSGVHTAMTNTRNTPVEALELAYPLRVERYALRLGSGGRGRFWGGDGVIREIDQQVSTATAGQDIARKLGELGFPKRP